MQTCSQPSRPSNNLLLLHSFILPLLRSPFPHPLTDHGSEPIRPHACGHPWHGALILAEAFFHQGNLHPNMETFCASKGKGLAEVRNLAACFDGQLL